MARRAGAAGDGGGRRWPTWLLAAALFALAPVVGGNQYLLARSESFIVGGVADAPARPVAIVLGNKVFPDEEVSGELADRLRVALDLYRAGRVGRIIVSGASHGDYDEPGPMTEWLVRRGVPRARVSLDRGGYRTAATMANAAAAGVRGALICTQAYHLPRALFLAQEAGIDAIGVPAWERPSRLDQVLRTYIRERLARTEIIAEVALRGVRAQ